MNNLIKPQEAVKIMASHDCHITLAGLYAWMQSEKHPCPFGVYVQKEGNERGTYFIFHGRLMAWLRCEDMSITYRAANNNTYVRDDMAKQALKIMCTVKESSP